MRDLELQPVDTIGQYVDSANISGALGDSHLIRMWLAGRPDNTVRAYQTDIRAFRLNAIKPIREVTAADLIDYAETLARLATSTQHRKLSVVKSLFSYACKLGYLRFDPAAALRLPKPADDRASKLLSVEAIHAIIAAAKPERDRLICRTLYLCGLREAELVAMDADHIQQIANGYTLSVNGKGDKQRTLALPPKLAVDLIEHCESGPIFQTVRNNRLNASDVYRLVRQAGHIAGHHITPHGLRHACASHALDAGAPLHVVRDTLGHTSLSTTSIYVHAKPDDSAGFYLNDASDSAQNGNK